MPVHRNQRPGRDRLCSSNSRDLVFQWHKFRNPVEYFALNGSTLPWRFPEQTVLRVFIGNEFFQFWRRARLLKERGRASWVYDGFLGDREKGICTVVKALRIGP